MDDLLPETTALALAYAAAQERAAADAEAAAVAEQARAQAEAAELAALIYDPLPYPEAYPADARMYVGTGIGALYGISPLDTTTAYVDDEGDTHEVPWSYDLAGWTLGREPK